MKFKYFSIFIFYNAKDIAAYISQKFKHLQAKLTTFRSK